MYRIFSFNVQPDVPMYYRMKMDQPNFKLEGHGHVKETNISILKLELRVLEVHIGT